MPIVTLVIVFLKNTIYFGIVRCDDQEEKEGPKKENRLISNYTKKATVSDTLTQKVIMTLPIFPGSNLNGRNQPT